MSISIEKCANLLSLVDFLFNAKWFVKFRENGNDLLIFMFDFFFIDQFLLFALYFF